MTPWPTSPVALALATAALLDSGQRLMRMQNVSNPFVDDAIDTELKRLGSAVAARVELYAASAPDSIRDEALIRAVAWLRDTVGAERYGNLNEIGIAPAPAASGNYFTASAARSRCLSPWRQRRAGTIQEA